ncbi:MAG: hypothetical protein F6K26_27305, partial [Moorea sp. SIO2I5]|nr:hypothetical protein [Moorena sp. SIO2I5]
CAVYHDVFTYHLRSPFVEEILKASLQHLASQHPILRTSLHFNRFSQPLQWVHESIEVPCHIHNIATLSQADQDCYVQDWVNQEKYQIFDWEQPPLFRVFIHERGAKTFDLSLSFHHVILDGWSVASLITSLLQDYWGRLGYLPPQPIKSLDSTYRDFIVLEQQAIQSETTRQFWQEYLQGAVFSRLPCPKERPDPHQQPRYDIDISQSLSD